MRILLADPDRDLLSGYRRLLERNGNTVQTAFDGTQVLGCLGTGAFDLAVMNEHLPRIAPERILHCLRDEKIPAIVLLDRPVHIRHLCRADLPCAYLSFPFSPSELETLARNVLEKARSSVRLNCGDITIRMDGFRVSGTEIYLTTDEMDLLAALCEKELPLPYRRRVYAHSLNEKLARLGGPSVRVAYREGKGCKLVRRV